MSFQSGTFFHRQSVSWVDLLSYNHPLSFLSFSSKSSERLLSTDTHTNTANYKFTYSVEIVPICKDDLVVIPLKLARQLGNINPLTVCTRVGNSLHLLDPNTLQSSEITSPIYWRTPFDSLASISDLREFTVLDVEPMHGKGAVKGKWVLADAQVALNGAFKSSGMFEDDGMMDYETSSGRNQIFHTRTHLGSILQPGDSVMGYFLSRANFNSEEFAKLPQDRIPDIMLVKKAYPNRRKKTKTRNWRLRSIGKEAGEEGETGGGRGVVGRMGGRDQRKVEQDYEMFLRDLEEDPEMRSAVNLYKADSGMKTGNEGSGMAGGKTRRKAQLAMDVDGGEAAKMHGENGMEQDDGGPVEIVNGETDGDVEEEPDFPEVKLEELLDHFDEMTLGDGEEAHEEE